MSDSTSAPAVPEYLTMEEAGQRFPGGKAPKTIRDWMTAGRKSKAGTPVVLKSCRVAGRRVTTVEWVNEFIAAVTEEDEA